MDKLTNGSDDDDESNVVVDTLQEKYDRLWKVTDGNTSWGVMDDIRLEQMCELKAAITIWKSRS